MNSILRGLSYIFQPLIGKVVSSIAMLTIYMLSAQAGKLEVLSNASTIGNQGLKVTVGKLCVIDDLVVLAGSITTDQAACDTVTTNGVVQVTSAASFTSGGTITLNPGFSVATGVTFDVTIDAFVKVPYAFVQSDKANAETSYNARFDMNTDALNLSGGEDIEHFTARSADNTIQFQLLLRLVGATKHLVLVARSSGTLVEQVTTIPLPAGFNSIFVKWKSGNGDGLFQVSLNNDAAIGPINLTNNASVVDSVSWGLVNGPVVVTSTGFIQQDDFFSFR